MDSSTSTAAELGDVGNKLLNDTSSIVELLSLLDKAENLLSRVEQDPSTLVADAMLPVMKALIRPELLSHSEIDIKASVVSCLHEIMRITAPDAPYEDKIMEEIFKLTVTMLKKLSLDSGHCYTKAISILHNMANVRSCLVMLDVEVDELIVEMFQLFFEIIRPHHPISVFSAMETIMTLIVDEVEGMPFELLTPILFSMRKGNQNVSPLSCKMGENVFKKCAAKLKPFLPEGLRLSASDVNDYADIVSSTCQHASGRDSKVTPAEEPEPKATGCGDDSPLVDGSSNSKLNNATLQVKNTQTLAEKNNGETLEGSACKAGDLGNSNSAAAHSEYMSASPSQKHGFSEGSHRKRGRPKKNKDPIYVGGDFSKESSGKKKVSFSTSRSRSEYESQFMKSCKETGKRKRAHPKQEMSEICFRKFGEELIGRRIKVWWPIDEMFYEGAIYSYDPLQKKHRVLYTDGEEELLDLSVEKFEFVKNSFPEERKDDTSKTCDENKDEEQKTAKSTEKSKYGNFRNSKDRNSSVKGDAGSSDRGKKKKKKSENFNSSKDQNSSLTGETGSLDRGKRKKKSESTDSGVGAKRNYPIPSTSEM